MDDDVRAEFKAVGSKRPTPVPLGAAFEAERSAFIVGFFFSVAECSTIGKRIDLHVVRLRSTTPLRQRPPVSVCITITPVRGRR